MRGSNEHDRAALSAAVKRALKRVGGGDCFCNATRVSASALSGYANPDRDDTHMPVDIVLDLERDGGFPVITAQLAQLQGYRLVPLEGGEGGPGLKDLAEVAGETGDVVRKLAEAIADGRIDRHERDALKKEIDEASSALVRVSRKLDDMSDTGGGA